MDDFLKFIISYKVDKGQPYTHVSMGHPVGSYNIPNDKLSSFYKLYTKKYLKIKNDDKSKLHILETHKEVGPIIMDIDFRFNAEFVVRKYKFTDIIQIIKCYFSNIKNYLNITNDKHLKAFIFEKRKPLADKGCVKDGIHIMFPYINTTKDVQHVIRECIVKDFQNNQYFQHLQLKNSLKDVFDEAIISRNSWMMYGSSKPGREPYRLTYILDKDLAEISIDKYLKDNNIIKTIKKLSIRTSIDNVIPVLENKQHEIKEYNNKIAKSLEKKKQSSQLYKNKSSDDILQDVQVLVNLLSSDRSDSFKEWLELGWCLHNIDFRLLDVWIEFSKKSPKYDIGDCDKRWNDFKKGGYELGSLYYWARNDNPEGYAKFQQEKVKDYIETIVVSNQKFTHHDIAMVIYNSFKYQFVCASIKYDSWYEFKNHRWTISEKGHCLRKILSSEVVFKFMAASTEFNNRYTNEASDKWLNGSQECLKTVQNLKTRKYKDDIMIECKEKFYDTKFMNKLDANIYLLGFNNGVYDLQNSIFRDGHPEDYISFSTNIDYIEYNENCEKVQSVYDLFQKIQPEKELYKYLLTSLASYLDGHIADEKLLIWTGTGSNGKSLTVEFFEKIFGDYCTKLPISLLTRKHAASNAASPEVAKTQGRRFGVLQEPANDDKINIGLMKELTGGDKIEARGLYKEPVIFKPQFKLLLTCNDLPKIPSDDGGTWRRLRVLPFKSEFCDDPVEPHQFKKDQYLIEKIDEWKEAFMSILIDYYKIYRKHGLKEPEEVTKHTNEYRKNSDNICEFIDENIESSDTSILKISEIYSLFRDWYKESQTNPRDCPSRQKVKKYFEKKFGKYNQKIGWHLQYKMDNIEMLEDDDDISN